MLFSRAQSMRISCKLIKVNRDERSSIIQPFQHVENEHNKQKAVHIKPRTF